MNAVLAAPAPPAPAGTGPSLVWDLIFLYLGIAGAAVVVLVLAVVMSALVRHVREQPGSEEDQTRRAGEGR